ncbi:3-keto-5-aminohexanoate cleavage protein [Conexibacter sp. CPCC 206217]|uniref:3-keto-5-aminohexanoate cleavage protein n=1 Tax=Conexibacter sp. CPCC 206217 TaxID=3064574 RepID=UPI002719252D|nr:3-keto-5-aminohexanoate cleavage protein [Conexibacter sp. CPCC 206217]MDO8212286.1 3-keto-5-aminohexanoate cleavage protein [Conexibacter sp. CPCC 206217]
MDKLVITVTVDSTMSYPGNPLMPPIEDTDAIAKQYLGAVEAGASICHHHGIHYLDEKMQDDGRKLSRIDFDGWQRMTDAIRGGSDAIVQYGIASARLPDKIELMKQGPDMMSYAFNVHDEYFQPDPSLPANEMYALHPRDELEEASRAALEHGVKLEVECFYTGAYWNLEFIRRMGLLEDPVWATLFFDWAGGAWTPPTVEAVTYMRNHLPPNVNWNTSIMDPVHSWRLIPTIVALGGHVRVGWEDNPYLPNGELAKTNAELVQEVVRIAEGMGREVATPAEAREITGLNAVRARTAGAAR